MEIRIVFLPSLMLGPKQIQRLIKKRSLGKPIAYLTNKKFFWDSEFVVSNDTLIPRPDTELIIEKVLKLTSNKKKMVIIPGDAVESTSGKPTSVQSYRFLDRTVH